MSDHWTLTSAALHGQPWRLWTAHIFPGSLALVPPLLLLHPKERMRTLVWGSVIAPLISIAMLACIPNLEFRGSSALAVTIWILTPLLYFNHHPYSDRRVPPAPAYVLLGFCLAKLLIETFAGATPLLLAHWLGAVAGAMTFIFLRAKLVHTAIRQFSESRSALSQRVC